MVEPPPKASIAQGSFPPSVFHVLRICVHAVGGGLICRVHVNDDVAVLDRQASSQIVMFKEVIKEPDSGGAFLSAGGENIPG